MSRLLSWSQAMHSGLYGPGGFYTVNSPHRHFRTSAQFPLFAEAVAELVRRVDAELGGTAGFTLVDVGSGSGELLSRVLAHTDLEQRLAPVAVELRPAPGDLDHRITWRESVPDNVTGLLLACEYLDNLPLDIAVVGDDGTVRYELVDPKTGQTAAGEPVSGPDAQWLRRWWPATEPGHRVEIGRPRDEEWRRLAGHVSRGTAVAIDYGHTRHSRPPLGTITGFVDGHQVEPLCDGSRDVTAHVAMDSLGEGRLNTQREALHELGISGRRPPPDQSRTDPVGYLKALSRAGDATELTDPAGFGGHLWLQTRPATA